MCGDKGSRVDAMTEMSFRYYSPVEGRVVPRFGTQTFIGASRSPSGFVINTVAVIAIPESEVAKFPKEYRNAISRGDLVAKTKADHDAFIRARADKARAKHQPAQPTVADAPSKPAKNKGKDRADEQNEP